MIPSIQIPTIILFENRDYLKKEPKVDAKVIVIPLLSDRVYEQDWSKVKQ